MAKWCENHVKKEKHVDKLWKTYPHFCGQYFK